MKKHWLVALGIALGLAAQGALAQGYFAPREPAFPRDVHGLWWQPNDAGWATTVFDHQDAMSAAVLVYDTDGLPTWFFASRLDCFREGPPPFNANCLGPMYRVTGPWFGERPFRPDQVRVEHVGEWNGWWGAPISFGGNGPDARRDLYMDYSINGWMVPAQAGQPMKVLPIDPEFPYLYYETAKSGLWVTRGESGWGVGFFQQGNKLTATLFVHDRNRQPRWYVAHLSGPSYSTDLVPPFEGVVLETRGHPYNAPVLENYRARQVGRASVQFGATWEEAAVLRYSVDGIEVTKTIHLLK